jgi:hypothetical protein
LDSNGNLNEKEYKKLFIKYAKEVSFEHFVNYFGKDSLYTTKANGGVGAFTAEELKDAFAKQIPFIRTGSLAPELVEKFASLAYEYSKEPATSSALLKLYQVKYIEGTLRYVKPLFIAQQEEGCYSHKKDGMLSLRSRYDQLLDTRLPVGTRVAIFNAVSDTRRKELIQEFMKTDNRELLTVDKDLKIAIYKQMSSEQLLVSFVERLRITDQEEIEWIAREILPGYKEEDLEKALEQFRTNRAQTACSASLAGKLMNLLILARQGGSMDILKKYYPLVAEQYQERCMQELQSNPHVKKRTEGFFNRRFKGRVDMTLTGANGEQVTVDAAKHLRQKNRAVKTSKKLERGKTAIAAQ